MRSPHMFLMASVLVLAAASTPAQVPEESWLDRPLSNWNIPGRAVPRAVPNGEAVSEIVKRCSMPILGETAGERALADAGWLPFHVFDRQMLQGDVEIIGGMAGADGMCRPADFNVYVFVNGSLAGRLSPAEMTSRNDASVGAVRLAGDGTIAAEFSRYGTDDPLCCPSKRFTVRYRVDRTPPQPVVVPISVQATRP